MAVVPYCLFQDAISDKTWTELDRDFSYLSEPFLGNFCKTVTHKGP